MEDLIPVLIGLAWMIVSMIRNKNKKDASGPQPAPKSDVPEWYQRMQEFVEPVKPQPVAAAAPPKPVAKAAKPTFTKPFLTNDRGTGLEEMGNYRMSASEGTRVPNKAKTVQPTMAKTDDQTNEWHLDTDRLRQAVVYATILERPYR